MAIAAAPPPGAPLLDTAAFDAALAAADSAVRTFRETLRGANTAMAERFEAGEPAHALVRHRADLVDALLSRAWRHCALAHTPDIALVAVGGYGRAELHPGSDIDLLILLKGDPDEALGERLQAFVTFLWDIGLEVGHSVRTLAECVTEARRDITVATNLLEARLIEGPKALFDTMRRRTSRDSIWPSRRFFEAKWQEQVSRHHRFDDAAYNLEPNVKEGPGGLRDLQVVGWVAKRHFKVETLHQLADIGFLTESELRTLVECQNFLWQVRFALHVLTGRREDRLLFDHQRRIAAMFGYRDGGPNLAVEQFMKRYYRTIMEFRRLNEMLLQLFQEAILYADAPAAVTPINKRFQARNGVLEVTRHWVFRRYPFALLELFLLMQQHPELTGVSAATIRLVRDHRYLIDESFREDLRCRSLFMEILRQPRGITHELRRMHRYGVLGAYLPAFGSIVGLMQYDLFHVYTVDQHSLFVVRNLRAFAVPERFHEFPLCSAVYQRLPKPELIYIAGLFHDIAKGRGGDHSTLGAEDARRFCEEHGLSQYDARLVAWLVRHHLLMSMTAQRRDITDPEVITEFAARVGDRNHLEYLYLLTVADVRATNPKLWNDFKDTLLRDLYESTLRALRRGLENPIDRAELIAETQADARRRLITLGHREADMDRLWDNLGDDYFLRSTPDEIAWNTDAILRSTRADLPLVLVRQGRGGTELFVYAPDQDFFFAATTSVLDRLRLTILDAQIITADNGMTLDAYIVLEENGEAIVDPAREHEIQHTLHEQLRNPRDAVGEVNRLPQRRLRHFPIPTRVSFYPDEPNRRTIMEVITADRPGLLSRVGTALASQGVHLQNAKIATFGARAEDMFFVTGEHNGPLDPAACQALGARITELLEEGPRRAAG